MNSQIPVGNALSDRFNEISYNKSGYDNDTRNDDINMDFFCRCHCCSCFRHEFDYHSNSKYFNLHGKNKLHRYIRRDDDCDFNSIFKITREKKKCGATFIYLISLTPRMTVVQSTQCIWLALSLTPL